MPYVTTYPSITWLSWTNLVKTFFIPSQDGNCYLSLTTSTLTGNVQIEVPDSVGPDWLASQEWSLIKGGAGVTDCTPRALISGIANLSIPAPTSATGNLPMSTRPPSIQGNQTATGSPGQSDSSGGDLALGVKIAIAVAIAAGLSISFLLGWLLIQRYRKRRLAAKSSTDELHGREILPTIEVNGIGLPLETDGLMRYELEMGRIRQELRGWEAPEADGRRVGRRRWSF